MNDIRQFFDFHNNVDYIAEIYEPLIPKMAQPSSAMWLAKSEGSDVDSKVKGFTTGCI